MEYFSIGGQKRKRKVKTKKETQNKDWELATLSTDFPYYQSFHPKVSFITVILLNLQIVYKSIWSTHNFQQNICTII